MSKVFWPIRFFEPAISSITIVEGFRLITKFKTSVDITSIFFSVARYLEESLKFLPLINPYFKSFELGDSKKAHPVHVVERSMDNKVLGLFSILCNPTFDVRNGNWGVVICHNSDIPLFI